MARLPVYGLIIFSLCSLALLLTHFYSFSGPPKIDDTQLERQPAVDNFPGATIPTLRQATNGTDSPLFIGFTRNWPLLQQAVVSYIAAGWPADQIYVVENTGVMDSNERGHLSLQNPFFLDYERLKSLRVNIIQTSTLLTFAQLQNFFIHQAITRGWETFFWSHMDVVVMSDEDVTPFVTLYDNVMAAREPANDQWGLKFYSYNRLALINVAAMKRVGGWDTLIPYYMGDCDMHQRLRMAGYELPAVPSVGLVFDVWKSLPDLKVLFPEPGEELSSERWKALARELQSYDAQKNTAKKGRNQWQGIQAGGQGQPFYRNPEGFEKGIQMWQDFGRKVYKYKWAYGECDLIDRGLHPEDAWKKATDPSIKKWMIWKYYF